jgi:hypothetical protein
MRIGDPEGQRDDRAAVDAQPVAVKQHSVAGVEDEQLAEVGGGDDPGAGGVEGGDLGIEAVLPAQVPGGVVATDDERVARQQAGTVVDGGGVDDGGAVLCSQRRRSPLGTVT